MKGFVTRVFNVAVHDRRGRRNADFMGGLDQLDPLFGADPPGRNYLANVIDQDFRRSSGQTADTGLFKSRKSTRECTAGWGASGKDLLPAKSRGCADRETALSGSPLTGVTIRDYL